MTASGVLPAAQPSASRTVSGCAVNHSRRTRTTSARVVPTSIRGIPSITGESSSQPGPSSGTFTFPGLPRESKVSVDAPGYLRTSVPVTQEEIRMSPLSFTIQVNEAGSPDKHIAKADIRQGTTLLGTTNDGGNQVISPYPGKDAKLLLCAAGYDQKEVTIHGVVGTFDLTPGTNACPPLPTPTPSPAPSDSTPSASPSASPSPTASP